jgi:proteasome lid subunit RPN8/RPN11
VHPTRNVRASPLAFEMDGLEVYRLIDAIEEDGGELGAIYHSHTRTEPYPSQTDRNFARLWPGLEWVIVGLRDDDATVRSYLIDDESGVREVEVK